LFNGIVSDMTANQEDVATGEKNVDVSISNSSYQPSMARSNGCIGFLMLKALRHILDDNKRHEGLSKTGDRFRALERQV
jgi:hypothetical protein